MNEYEEDDSAEAAPMPLVFTNAAQFERIGGDRLILFYRQIDSERSSFDPMNDERLLSIFAAVPYEFDGKTQLREYEALVSRQAYELRAHPDQASARELAAVQLTPELAAELFILVYRRIAGTRYTPSPFAYLNGTEADETPVVLFRRYSFEPVARATPLWHDAERLGASIGLLGVRIDEQFN